MVEKLERIYTVPLGKAYEVMRGRRTRRAVKLLRKFAGRHMKTEEENVFLSNALNNYLWKRSIQKPPRRVKVRLIKENGKVRAYLADEKIEEKKAEPKKEEKPKVEKKKEEPKGEKKKKEVEEKEKELKKEQTVKAEAAMAKKESKKAIKDEEAKIEEAKKRKFAHGKET